MSPQQTVDASQNVGKRKNVKNTRRCNRQAEKSSVKDYFVLFSGLCACSHTRARRMIRWNASLANASELSPRRASKLLREM